MKAEKIQVSVSEGVTAKIAARLVSELNGIDSLVHFEVGNKRVNAKSIMGLISLLLKKEDTIIVFVDGRDSELALQIVKNVIG